VATLTEIAQPATGGPILGYDISWPQCGGVYPKAPYEIAIVGVNGGRPFTGNECFASEFEWARKATGNPAVYINLDSPRGEWGEAHAVRGPMGECGPGDEACRAYNYGANSARFAIEHAHQKGARPAWWWLDIETMNYWSPNTKLNAEVIRGAINYLRQKGMNVGIYSTAHQWRIIVGDYAPSTPVWVAGAPDQAGAPPFCGPEYAFGGGEVWIVQYLRDGYDGALGCEPYAG
jgi:hypothetical protein